MLICPNLFIHGGIYKLGHWFSLTFDLICWKEEAIWVI